MWARCAGPSTKRQMLKGDQFCHEFVVTRSIYTGFISLFGDRNPLHTELEFSRQKGFNGLVMHGNILNGFVSYFIGELLPVKNVIIQSQEIKFSKPVYLDDSLKFTATVEDVYESVNTIEFKFRFTNLKGIKVATGKIMVGLI